MQLRQEPIPNYNVLCNYDKRYPQLEHGSNWCPIFPILKFQDVTVNNENFSVYINRTVNKQGKFWIYLKILFYFFYGFGLSFKKFAQNLFWFIEFSK